MNSLRSRIDREALDWANEKFSRAGFSGGGDDAAEADILGMERHITECMWALVTKCKTSAAESLPGATKSFYHLMNILSEVGLSEDDTSGLFLPVPMDSSDDSNNEELLQFPPEEHEGEYTQHAQLVSEIPLLHHFTWAPLYCVVLFDLSPPENNVIRFLDDCQCRLSDDEYMSPVHEILSGLSTTGGGILSDGESVELLKVIQKFTPWAFRIYGGDRGLLPLHTIVLSVIEDVNFEVLQVVADSYPEAAGVSVVYDDGTLDGETILLTPINGLVKSLLQAASKSRELVDYEDIEKLKYLISVTPTETFMLQNASGYTPIYEVLLSYRDQDGRFPDLRILRPVFDACPAAAKLLCLVTGELPLESYCFSCFVHYPTTSELTAAELEADHPEVYLILRDLVAATGDALRIPDANGLFCLHRLCRRPWLPALQLVCEAYPDALQVNVPRLGTPLHIVLGLRHGILGELRWAAAKFIHSLYPDAAHAKDPELGLTAMQVAVSDRYISPNLEWWKWLYDCNPAAIREKNNGEDLPIHSFVRATAPSAVNRYYNRSEGYEYPIKMLPALKWFLRLYPESAAIPNNEGESPYDIYMEAVEQSDGVVRAFLTSCPHLDIQRFRQLNYDARSGALRVLYHLRHTSKPASLCTEQRADNSQVKEEGSEAVRDAVIDGCPEKGRILPILNSSLSHSELKLNATRTAWWQMANTADMTIVKEVVSYL